MQKLVVMIFMIVSCCVFAQNVEDTALKSRVILYYGNEFIGQVISKVDHFIMG